MRTPEHPGSFSAALRGGAAIALPQAAGAALLFIVQVAVARWLGPGEFGAYAYALSWTAILSIAAVLGLDHALIRYIPVYAYRAAWELLRGVLLWASAATVLVSLTIAAAVFLVAARFPIVTGPVSMPVLVAAVVLVPLLAVTRLQQAALRAMQLLALSQLPESIVLPAVVLGFVGVAVATGIGASAETALIAHVVAATACVVVAVALVYLYLPTGVRGTPARFEHRPWLMASGGLVLLTALAALNSRLALLMLGSMSSSDAVGAYAAAFRGSAFVALGLNVTVLAMSPVLAAMYASGRHAELEAVARRVSAVAIAVAAPVALALLLWGSVVLALFGPGFEVASGAMSILVAGEIANVAAGPVATLLIVSGRVRKAVLGLAVATMINLAVGLVLIPRWDLDGAAMANALSVAAWNIILWHFVRRDLAISPTILLRGVRRGTPAELRDAG